MSYLYIDTSSTRPSTEKQRLQEIRRDGAWIIVVFIFVILTSVIYSNSDVFHVAPDRAGGQLNKTKQKRSRWFHGGVTLFCQFSVLSCQC